MNDELKAAAEIVRQHRYREKYHSADVLLPAMRMLANYMIDKLAADEAERVARAKPINEDWLEQIGVVVRDDKRAFAVSLGELCNVVVDRESREVCARFKDAFKDHVAMIVATRGQLLNLLKALKGGA